MSSPDSTPPTYQSLCIQPELSGTPNDIYFYAPAIYGQDTKKEELKVELNSVYLVEDDEEDVIKVSYYADEDDIDHEDKVLQAVQGIDDSARRIEN